ncbi:MAG: hypothetical protein JSS76_14485 [Bacteroidetes bacterium]|nr:hypothetical protein [Bacteroidota bacterium]
MEEFKILTPHDLAFGIGRKATKAALKEWLSRTDIGESVSAEQLLEEMRKRNIK